MNEIQLKVEQLSKDFYREDGSKVIGLRDIQFEIQKGELVSIVGTNGAGKSTLLNILAGMLPADSGRIYLADERIDHLNPLEYAKHIGRVFQDPRMGTAPRMTVFENLMLAQLRGEKRGFRRSLTPENKQKMSDLLKPFNLNLETLLDVPIDYLSGGQRQTVALLMATLKRPELLLLDEHTAALDPKTSKQVMEETVAIVKQNQLTTLMITHQLADALDYSDRILVLYQGHIHRAYTRDQIQGMTPGDLYMILESLSQEVE
ncbi:ABC transporter ATP-binding protein [Dolosicoccus paucivorans]|uniref:ABC transporter ATP-binding protein n=1 Tax=Dolosicoccus paucivorans TaxID=84521 RepID=A0A1G8J500_9LACT|nr:ATP-binding cassette domain-containing protein [Dolosicoccus paucivorans]PMB84404.1 ABC transporter ATP-binding protein [Dolosicoccus paucivorans]PMC59067.1 ABC transporter ATP-binding protein [Dolosicoccus paucivorans]SDI25720.1 putative ABC transport system ATP-binding protein [Dolosicoccus paucivorans]